jgi:hypothetical protein
MILQARICSKARLTKDAMMQAENTHFAMSMSTIFVFEFDGLITEDHSLNARSDTAVNVSTP